MVKQTASVELVVPGIIPELYREIVMRIYIDAKQCTSIEQVKTLSFPGKKPGSLSVCAYNGSIIFFERRQNVFAQINFNHK